jgi:tetratricopeptide (TPR) repeat protein
MNLLGRRSLSSFFKVLLDVAFYATCLVGALHRVREPAKEAFNGVVCCDGLAQSRRFPMASVRSSLLLTLAGGLIAASASAQNAALGTINFPNSGSAAAKPYFVEGVKFLHSFEWEDAAEAFRKAQQADPGFALAYWGEALSHTGGHHYPPEQDIAAARKALLKLAPSRAERLAKAATERERGYLNAVEVLYGDGDGHERMVRYAEAMGQLSERFPDDDDAATLYALALMRTARRGQESTRVDLQAGAIALRVFRRNGQHPGAVHYIVHAFDEPTRAPVALEAAGGYATLAPDAPHALHMPSHIYVQLGLWDKLSAANERSYAASARRSEQKQLRGIEGQAFHAMFWLHYAYLMQGNFAKAEDALARAERHAKTADAGPNRTGQVETMRARHIIETERWKLIDVAPILAQIKAAPDRLTARITASTLLAAALSASHLQNRAAADMAAGGLRDLVAAMKANGFSRNKAVEIMALEAEGMALLADGNRDAAVKSLQQAAAIEESMEPPSGPPGEQDDDPPIKPAHELLGEVLLDADRPADAAKQLAIGLDRTPNRPRMVIGAARAALKMNDQTTARLRYQQLVNLPGGGPDRPGLDEAKAFVGSSTGGR